MIKKFYTIKKEYDAKKNSELKKTGIFYAFGDEQWEEEKTHKDAPDNDYLRIGGGAYIHKSNKSKLDNFFEVILKQLNKDFIDKVGIENIIEYELINHECYYTGNWQDVITIIENYLDSDISQRDDVVELIEMVYRKTYEKNTEDF